MKLPVVWTEADLAKQAARSEGLFRTGRLAASEVWSAHFSAARGRFEELFRHLDDLASSTVTVETLAGIYTDQLGDMLRYLAGPPISNDDLKKLADVRSTSPAALSNDRESLAKIYSVIEQSIDFHRFPWLREGNRPSKSQKDAALLASAALFAAQSIATARRNDAKREQEDAVKAFLAGIGLTEVPPARIGTILHGPQAMQFCGESVLGSRKADVIVRLHDTRLLAIECKVSSSVLNSVKRVNNDAAAKAEEWISRFGTDQVVPAAVLGGVFGVPNLMQAQERGLHLFWAHDLERLGEFIASTKPAAPPVKGRPRRVGPNREA
jgi:hypothetical protein